jgi:hypothetical protein
MNANNKTLRHLIDRNAAESFRSFAWGRRTIKVDGGFCTYWVAMCPIISAPRRWAVSSVAAFTPDNSPHGIDRKRVADLLREQNRMVRAAALMTAEESEKGLSVYQQAVANLHEAPVPPCSEGEPYEP